MSNSTDGQHTFAPPSQVSGNITYSVPDLPKNSRIAVVGAGVFGGWTALQCLRLGYQVTLLDAWGPGHSRSSSGDETRVIRSTYGANELYFDLNRRAWQLWQENEAALGRPILHKTGALWFCYQPHNEFIEASLPFMKKHGLAYQYYTPAEAAKQYPHIHFDGLDHVVYDAEAGYLKAREGCQAVAQAFVREGGRYVQQWVRPGPVVSEHLTGLQLANGEQLAADVYVFAGGPWLGQLFPEVLGPLITATRQEVFYFGQPAYYAAGWENLPVWIDWDGHDFYYGIPGNAHRGFKVACDLRGPVIDPTTEERLVTAEKLALTRQFLAKRFPALAQAPVAESRVCQYENSPDGNFILDRHPEAQNLWLLGGGSGHGYKHGPALGEMAAQIISGRRPTEALFQLARFQG